MANDLQLSLSCPPQNRRAWTRIIALPWPYTVFFLLALLNASCKKNQPLEETSNDADVIPALEIEEKIDAALSWENMTPPSLEGIDFSRADYAIPSTQALKCFELGQALRRAKAKIHDLPASARLELPQLATDQAVLIFFQRENLVHRYLLLGSGENQVKTLKPLAQKEIDPLIIKARDQIEYGSLDGKNLWGLLYQLQQILMGDVRGHLSEAKQLTIVADGLLRFLPFTALVTKLGPPRPRFLIEDFILSNAPCLHFVRPLQKQLLKAEILAPFSENKINRLLGTLSEVLSMSDNFQTHATYLGEKSGPQLFLEAASHEDTVVHFAGHGLTDLSNQEPPELIFQKSSLPLGKFTERRILAPLIVLASCQTAYVARFRDGQQLFAPVNMVEAVLAAGGRAVVAASWPVKDQESAAQMQIFYAHVQDEGPAAALARAQRARLAQIKPPHPRVWAFYSAFGAPR